MKRKFLTLIAVVAAAMALALLAGLLLTHRLPEAEAWLRGSFPGLNW